MISPDRRLPTGQFGSREPADSELPDFVLIPLSAQPSTTEINGQNAHGFHGATASHLGACAVLRHIGRVPKFGKDGPPLEKRKRPGLIESRDALVEQSSPENCSHTPYVLLCTGAIARRNTIYVT